MIKDEMKRYCKDYQCSKSNCSVYFSNEFLAHIITRKDKTDEVEAQSPNLLIFDL